MSISTIRAGLASALANVSGVGRAFAYFPDDIVAPCGIVVSHSADFDEDFARGTDTLVFNCMVVVRRTDERVAQEAIDTLIPLVKSGLESDTTLGGACYDLRVTGYSTTPEPLQIGETIYLAASFAVRIIAAA